MDKIFDLKEDHGGNIYKAQRMCKGKVLDFSANINPLGLPSYLKKAIQNSLRLILHYPDPDVKDLTQAIARHWKIKEANVLVGNGSVELIYLIVQALRPKRALIASPTFSDYERALRLAGARIQFINLNEREGFRMRLDRISKLEPQIVDEGLTPINKGQNPTETITFLCNPNNPTGNLLFERPKEEISEFFKGFIVIDEAFMDFLPDEAKHTLIWEATRNERLIVLRTLTKLFALPGLRLGYLVATKEVIQDLKRFRIPWSVNALAQVAGEAILKDKGYISRTRTFIVKERTFLFDEIAKLDGFRPYPSVTNFLLVKIEKDGLTSSWIQQKLLERGILVRNCSNFRTLDDRFFRVAVRTRKENSYLLENLKNIYKRRY